MKRYIKLLFRKFAGDWWTPVFKDGSWGVYHPWRLHKWDYPYHTKGDAQKECDEQNEIN